MELGGFPLVSLWCPLKAIPERSFTLQSPQKRHSHIERQAHTPGTFRLHCSLTFCCQRSPKSKIQKEISTPPGTTIPKQVPKSRASQSTTMCQASALEMLPAVACKQDLAQAFWIFTASHPRNITRNSPFLETPKVEKF